MDIKKLKDNKDITLNIQNLSDIREDYEDFERHIIAEKYILPKAIQDLAQKFKSLHLICLSGFGGGQQHYHGRKPCVLIHIET